MKNTIYSTLLVLVCLIVLAQPSNAQNNSNANSERYFEVQLNKETYILQEPVFAEFKARLLSTDEEPLFLHETLIKVKFESKVQDFGRISLITEPPVRLPGVLPNNGLSQIVKHITYEREENLSRAGEFFSKPGKYQIQFFLHGKNEKLASNTIELTIEEPTGINKKAFEFLNKYEDGFSFDWVYKEKNGIKLLEEFVAKYSQSVFGESAISQLGLYYFTRDELNKAQEEFEKLKFSRNKLIAEAANSYLLDIDNRRTYLQKQQL